MAAKSKSSKFDGLDTDFLSSREDPPESRTVASRQLLRRRLTSDVDEFLSSGGEIEVVDTHKSADPPRKPQSNYGGRPI